MSRKTRGKPRAFVIAWYPEPLTGEATRSMLTYLQTELQAYLRERAQRERDRATGG